MMSKPRMSNLFTPLMLALLMMFCATGALQAAPAQGVVDVSSSPAYSNWRLVAQSNLVVRGRLIVPVKTVRSFLKSKKRDYLILRLQVHQVIKGTSSQKLLAIRVFSVPASYDPSLQTILSLHQKNVLAMIVQTDGSFAAGQLFFAGYSRDALQLDAPALSRRVQKEVQNQNRIAQKFSLLPVAQPDALHSKVKSLIEAMVHEKTEEQAFAQLESLGVQAVPSTIRLMNDVRRLPIPRIVLRNKAPGAFEGERQYAPLVVVDALQDILNQLTGESFGDTGIGVSARERQRGINGWRVFLHYKLASGQKISGI